MSIYALNQFVSSYVMLYNNGGIWATYPTCAIYPQFGMEGYILLKHLQLSTIGTPLFLNTGR